MNVFGGIRTKSEKYKESHLKITVLAQFDSIEG